MNITDTSFAKLFGIQMIDIIKRDNKIPDDILGVELGVNSLGVEYIAIELIPDYGKKYMLITIINNKYYIYMCDSKNTNYGEPIYQAAWGITYTVNLFNLMRAIDTLLVYYNVMKDKTPDNMRSSLLLLIDKNANVTFDNFEPYMDKEHIINETLDRR